MTIRFHLKNPKDKNGKLRNVEVTIYAVVTKTRNERFTVTLDEKIQPKDWDFKNQQVKSTYRGHYEVNLYLLDFKTKLLKLYRDNRDMPFPKFKELALSRPSEEKKTLFIAIEQFLEQYKAEKDSKTLGKYNVMAKQLRAYDKIHSIDLHTLDFNFYDGFKKFLYQIPNPNYRKHSLLRLGDTGNDFDLAATDSGLPVGLFDDTVFKYFVNIKTFCAWAEKRGHKVDQSYKSWEIIERRYPPISLTLSELEHLETFEFTVDSVKPHIKKNGDVHRVIKALDIARDYLVFECRTGQRISDIKRFDLKDFSDDKWTFTPRKGNRLSSKTNTVYFKGYCQPALFILQKYNWKMPVVSEQKINDNIKTACKIAGIDQETITYRWAQNKRIRIAGPKYEFISTHCGRRSFVTIAMQFMSHKIVKDLAGIESWATLKHYEGNSESSNIEQQLEKISWKTTLRKAQ